MSVVIPTPETLKEKAKSARKFLKEKCESDVSHSQCLELVSHIYGFKDWNTASAEAKPKQFPYKLPRILKNVGEMKKALAPLEDSTEMVMWNTTIIENFIEGMKDLKLSNGALHNQYSLILEMVEDGKISIQLKLEDQKYFTTDGMEKDPLDDYFGVYPDEDL